MNLPLLAFLLLISLFLATPVNSSALQSGLGNGNDLRLVKGETGTSLSNNVQNEEQKMPTENQGNEINDNIKASGGHGRGAGGGAGGNGNRHSLNKRNAAPTTSVPLIYALILSFVCAYIVPGLPL